MTRAEAVGVTVDALIDAYPEPQRTIVRRLRDLIREVAPHLEESVKWGVPVYGRGATSVFSLVPHGRHVNLQVFNGAALAERHALLEGTGKGLRHVKCRTPEKVGEPALRAMLMASLSSAGLDRSGFSDARSPA